MTKKNLLLLVAQDHNECFILINYDGPEEINARLIEAVIKALDFNYDGCGWKTFSSIKIIKRFTDCT